MKRACGMILTAALLACGPAALADTVSLSGEVTADDAAEVYAPIGGLVEKVRVKVGQSVREGDALMTLRTTKIYAETDGVVNGVFGQPGDLVDTPVNRYGAILYIQPNAYYTVSASTEYAYSSTETKTVHIGETVYVRASSNQNRTGVGRVTAVSGTKFAVEVTQGEFITGEKAYVYRDAEFSRKLKLGYGEVSRTEPVAVTLSSSGVRTSTTSSNSSQSSSDGSSTSSSSSSTTSAYSIAAISVADRQSVKRGDLVAEVLMGAFDGLYMSGADILADCDGVVATLPYNEGVTIAKNAVVATLYTQDDMCVEAAIPEENLKDIHEGDRVKIELATDETRRYEGVVRMISAVGSKDDAGAVTFTAWIDFTPDDAVRYGSSVLVETIE